MAQADIHGGWGRWVNAMPYIISNLNSLAKNEYFIESANSVMMARRFEFVFYAVSLIFNLFALFSGVFA
jgi:hypothetical protein